MYDSIGAMLAIRHYMRDEIYLTARCTLQSNRNSSNGVIIDMRLALFACEREIKFQLTMRAQLIQTYSRLNDGTANFRIPEFRP